MLLPIAIAAAVAAAPLPEGRGGRPTPLAITSDVPGAVARVLYRNQDGALTAANCAAPCTLQIPSNSPLKLWVRAPDGTLLKHPPLSWKAGGALKFPFSEELSPAAIHAVAP